MRFLLPLLLALPCAANATEITFAVTHQPPYMIEETKSGIFVDLITEIFSAAGQTAKPVFLPNRRAFASFEEKKVDGVLYYFGDKAKESCRTENYANYQPTLVALKKNNFSLKTLDGLQGQRVGAFLGAKDYFVPDYPEYPGAVAKARDYREEADITRISKLLLNDRIDIGILDWRLFLWTAKAESQGNLYAVRDIERHPYFATAWVGAQFWNAAHCEAFNKGLAILKSNGRYDAINQKYSDDVLGGM
jgi:polar amino acid transport system substrate-binding protein